MINDHMGSSIAVNTHSFCEGTIPNRRRHSIVVIVADKEAFLLFWRFRWRGVGGGGEKIIQRSFNIAHICFSLIPWTTHDWRSSTHCCPPKKRLLYIIIMFLSWAVVTIACSRTHAHPRRRARAAVVYSFCSNENQDLRAAS